MQNEAYQEAVLEAVYTLNNAENEIFTAMVNVGFKGVYDDISKLHEKGEVLNLVLAMFERTSDTNLDKLIEAIQAVAKVKLTLINLNALPIEIENLP